MQAVCQLEELGNLQCREFELRHRHMKIAGFVCRKGEQFYAYRNSCPHSGVPLNWKPNDFFDFGLEFLQCTIHGALFQVEDGLCLRGPCRGQSLQPLAVHIDAGIIHVSIE